MLVTFFFFNSYYALLCFVAFFPLSFAVIRGQTRAVQVSAAGRRGSPGSGLAVSLRRQVKGRAGHQFGLALPLPRARPSLPVVTELGWATGGSGSRWHTGAVRGWGLVESPGLNVRLRASNLPLLPSGAVAAGGTRLLCGFSMAKGMWWGPGSTGQHLPGGWW